MAKFLDLNGLSHAIDKIKEWADGAFRKKADKVLSTEVTYNGKTLDEAIKSGEFKGEKESKELLDRKDQPVLPEHRDHREFRDLLGQREKHLKSQKLMNL